MPTLTTHSDSASHAASTLHVALDLATRLGVLHARQRLLPHRGSGRFPRAISRRSTPSSRRPVGTLARPRMRRWCSVTKRARWFLAAAGVHGRGDHRARRGFVPIGRNSRAF